MSLVSAYPCLAPSARLDRMRLAGPDDRPRVSRASAGSAFGRRASAGWRADGSPARFMRASYIGWRSIGGGVRTAASAAGVGGPAAGGAAGPAAGGAAGAAGTRYGRQAETKRRA